MLNRCTTRALVLKTPFEALYGMKPNLRHLRVLGCKCFVHIPKSLRSKFGAKAFQAIFVGYDTHTKGYRCYDVVRRCIVISRDVVFIEDSLGDFGNLHHHDVFADILHNIAAREGDLQAEVRPPPAAVPPQAVNRAPVANQHPPDELHQQDLLDLLHNAPDLPQEGVHDAPQDDNPIQLQDELVQIHGCPLPRRSGRLTQRSVKLKDFVSLAIHDDPSVCHVETTKSTSDDISLGSALAHPGWQAAMLEEFQALIRNNTWELTALPPGRKAITSKWVFKTKPTTRPTHTRLKARVVARGLEQKYGIDFNETFAPVVHWSILRAILALAVSLGWSIEHMDVVTAFLNGLLKEEIYMHQPPAFAVPGKEDMVCRLRRSLYGLKQSPREWYLEIDSYLRQSGWIHSEADPNLYYLVEGSTITILLLYVDDLLLIGNSALRISQIKQALSRKYEMKDLGALQRYLGVEFTRTEHSMQLNQSKYISDLLTEQNMLDCKHASTPLPEGFSTQSETHTPTVDRTLYCQIVGKLLYLTNTRPDLSYAVGIVARFMSAPQQQHLDAVRHILRYLRGTMNHGLFYKAGAPVVLEGFTDSAYLDCVETR